MVDFSRYPSTLQQLFSRPYFLIYSFTKKMQRPFIRLLAQKAFCLASFPLLPAINADKEALWYRSGHPMLNAIIF